MKCLVIGGGGPVGTALLYLLKHLGWTAAVVDPKRPRQRAVHDRLLADTLESWTEESYGLEELDRRLAQERFDIVVDLSPTLDKRRSVTLCDARGLSLLNGTMVDCKDDIHIAAYNFLESRPAATNRPHIVASGMNPGALNAMAEDVIHDHPKPDAIIYWEYDDTAPADGVFRGPAITWCPGESAAEMDEDWNFEVLEEGTVLLHEDALSWSPESYRTSGVPLDHVPIPAGGDAFLIGHEECIYMGWRHDTAVKFVYGFHPENMRLIREAGWGFKPELLLCAPGATLRGGDIVGVSCRYGDLWRGQYCRLDNTPATPVDTNATCMLVASGLAASLAVLDQDGLRPGVHLTHELEEFMPAFRSMAQVQSFLIEGGKTTVIEDVRADAAHPPLLARMGV